MALKSVERRVDELDLNKQDNLVSGSNIKTINGSSILGDGNLVISTASTITVGTTPVTSGTDGRVFFQSGGVVQQDSSFFWDNTNKRLGIGTSTPNDSLNIVGYNKFIKIEGAAVSDRSAWLGATSNGTGDLYLFNGNNSNSIYITGNGTSFFNGGNVSIGATTAGARLDVRAQGALSTDIAFRVRNSADTANLLSLNGTGVLSISSIGNDITINGVNIGRGGGNIDTNTRVGTNAGFFNTTGNNNSFFGRNSGFNNTTGSNNVFYGLNSGRFILGGGSLTIANDSVFIGYDTRANADNETNQIVIGHNAIGTGSNSVTLGNTSITRTNLRGQVVISGFASAPTGVEGAIYYDSTTKKHYGFDGTNWNALY